MRSKKRRTKDLFKQFAQKSSIFEHSIFRLVTFHNDERIERFIGKNLNAVLIQIFSTLMAYVLMALLKTFYKASILKVSKLGS